MREQTKSSSGAFSEGFFQFLSELKENNTREWFQANKSRYESDVKAPMLRFIAEFGERLSTISQQFVADARPSGGSMFRIHRDTRFSNDKSPYKTHVAALFPHNSAGKTKHVPGFYLHLDPDHCFAGGGLWHPDAVMLKAIRDRIAEQPAQWKAVLDTGLEVVGESLKRPPAGYDKEHPYIEDLKRKDYVAMTELTSAEVCAADFMERFYEACKATAPLVRFVTKALELPW